VALSGRQPEDGGSEDALKVISMINDKGGVGKTTLTANLGAGLAARGKSVLLIDLDPQASLTLSFFTQNEWLRDLLPDKTIKEWYDGVDTTAGKPLAQLITTPPRLMQILAPTGGNLDLIGAHRDLGDVDVGLAARLMQDQSKFFAVHERLRVGLTEPEFASYDVVLIDCAPNFGMLARTAIAASDLLVVPTRPDYLSTTGLDSLGRKVTEWTEQYNRRLGSAPKGARRRPLERPPMVVVFTMVQLYNGEPVEGQRSYISRVPQLGVPTFETLIRDNKTVYGTAPEHGIPVILGGTGRQYVRELRELVSELLDRLEKIPA
jgi:chromosome partitioning protein